MVGARTDSHGGACACEASVVPSEATLLTPMPIGARACAPVMLIGRRPGPLAVRLSGWQLGSAAAKPSGWQFK